jgi:ATP-binding cassette subfamily F protein uup
VPAVLLGCQNLGRSHGDRVLFRGLSFGLFEGDHVGLVGPNGAGKSTLLRILAGLETPDTGARAVRGGLRIGYVDQDPTFAEVGTVEDAVAAGLTDLDEAERAGRVALALGRAGFADGHAPAAALSGGWRKRLAIARALAAEPDVLLMDEPTNHLDVEGILWLEDVLVGHARAFVAVSHDRYFLERVAARVIELNRAFAEGLFEAEGRYSEFLVRRDEFLRGQAAYEESLANAVRREIAWLRQGAKARSTKAKGRIDEASRVMQALEEARARGAGGSAGIAFTSSPRRTRRLLVAQGLAVAVDGRRLFAGLDLAITPGTRVGLIGPNGSGKTTLLDVLAGAREPAAGRIERAEGLRAVRFEQQRAGLDPGQSLRRALAPEGDAVTFQGRSVHVASWAKRFLFRPEQLDVPVGRLSGGEQARILIARLMREPADLMFLDEPTNDLDIPTLEVLEDSLTEFEGGLVLVTHDRFLLDRVSTTIVALDGEGTAEVFADYAQWDAARAGRAAAARAPAPPPPPRERPRTRRLGYREQREWDGMEQTILDAEAAVEACRRAVDDPAVASDASALQARIAALDEAQAEVDRLYTRWAELEAKLAADPA